MVRWARPDPCHDGAEAAIRARPSLRDALSRGELVRLLPQWAPRRQIVHAVFASRRGLLPSVRALIDFLADRFEKLAED